MSTDAPSVAVIFKGEPAPKKYKATTFDWVKYYAYNLARKPKVWSENRKLLKIADEIKYALHHEVLLPLQVNAPTCQLCRNAYGALLPQFIVSQIKLTLQQFECEDHPMLLKNFLARHLNEFKKSEEIAAWINGFR